MDIDGSNLEQVTYNADADVEYDYPCFSPDGTKIAYHSNKNGDYDIYEVDYRGYGDAAPLAHILTPVQFEEVGGQVAVVGSAKDNVSVEDGETVISEFESYTLDYKKDGEGDWTEITTTTTAVDNGTLGTFDARYVTKGTYTLRLRVTDGIDESVVYRIVSVVPTQGIILEGSHEYYPSYSPDGTKIAYSSDAAGNNDIWVRNADGSGDPVQVTTHTGADYWLSGRNGDPFQSGGHSCRGNDIPFCKGRPEVLP